MARIVGLQHVEVTIPTDSENAARDFYSGFLGLHEVPKPEALRPRGGFWLSTQSTCPYCGHQHSSPSGLSAPLLIHIGVESGTDVHRAATKAHVAYEVADLAAWKARLDSHRIRWQSGIKIPQWIRLEFRDPFGNRIELMQHEQVRRDPHAPEASDASPADASAAASTASAEQRTIRAAL
jgi:catechol 2,3-dioxygenase-like lactoylglutathione lyase family enzyme